jgi:general secretion pathway protein G
MPELKIRDEQCLPSRDRQGAVFGLTSPSRLCPCPGPALLNRARKQADAASSRHHRTSRFAVGRTPSSAADAPVGLPAFSTPDTHPTRRRLLARGFTLVELMIVMAIISILVAIALPIYAKSLIRAKESVLRNNLFSLRTMIDEYTIDKQHAPATLDDLVSEGYLHQVPQDPITGSNQTWKLIMEDTPVNPSQPPGIFDVRSGSDKVSLDGTNYADW